MMLSLKTTSKTTLTNPSQKQRRQLHNKNITTSVLTTYKENVTSVSEIHEDKLTPFKVKTGSSEDEHKLKTESSFSELPQQSALHTKRKKHTSVNLETMDSSIPQDGFVFGAYVKREQSFIEREQTGDLQFVYLCNDNKLHTLKLLTDVKNVYSRQLPNMPKEYICKLVFNKTHRSVAVLKTGKTVVGGITYKTFEDQSFAEIAFCAVEGLEQVRGIGTRMMNYCKCYARKFDRVERFLTYADNNAIGYFAKQGFVKRTLPQKKRVDYRRSIKSKDAEGCNGQTISCSSKNPTIPLLLDPCEWAGYIKDYDGGTLMECELVPRAPYLNCPGFVKKHWDALDKRIRQKSSSHVIYPGMEFPKDGKRRRLNPINIPGLKQAGWTPDQLNRNLYFKIDGNWEQSNDDSLHSFLQCVLKFLKQQPEAQPFLKPVTIEDAADYFDIIKDPMDLSRIEERLKSRGYYSNLEIFKADVDLMLGNCRIYNRMDTFYYKYANRLELAFQDYLSQNSMEY